MFRTPQHLINQACLLYHDAICSRRSCEKVALCFFLHLDVGFAWSTTVEIHHGLVLLIVSHVHGMDILKSLQTKGSNSETYLTVILASCKHMLSDNLVTIH